jgi:hypothetical protein
MWIGRRTVFDWLARARLMDCLIHQAQIGPDHVVACLFFALFDALGELVFLFDREQGCARDFPEVELHAGVRVVCHGVELVCFTMAFDNLARVDSKK